MGVRQLWKVLEPAAKPVLLESLRGKVLAIDASIWIYQFLKAMRDSSGDVMRAAHIVGFFRRICKLLFFEIKPVFVFDGAAPILKRLTVDRRKHRRQKREFSARATANKLLTLQMQRSHAPKTGLVKGSISANPKYLDGESNDRFVPQSQYDLPDIAKITSVRMNDQRLLSEEELDDYARQFTEQAREGFIDSQTMDFNSAEFRNLPQTTQYQLLNEARLKSRLRMGYTSSQLEAMFPNRMDFSRFQINRVAQRNFFTQRLMNLVGLDDDLTTKRISSEKNKEYVLKKNSGGWSMSLADRDKTPEKQGPKDASESEDEFEDVDLDPKPALETESLNEDLAEEPPTKKAKTESEFLDHVFGFEDSVRRKRLYDTPKKQPETESSREKETSVPSWFTQASSFDSVGAHDREDDNWINNKQFQLSKLSKSAGTPQKEVKKEVKKEETIKDLIVETSSPEDSGGEDDNVEDLTDTHTTEATSQTHRQASSSQAENENLDYLPNTSLDYFIPTNLETVPAEDPYENMSDEQLQKLIFGGMSSQSKENGEQDQVGSSQDLNSNTGEEPENAKAEAPLPEAFTVAPQAASNSPQERLTEHDSKVVEAIAQEQSNATGVEPTKESSVEEPVQENVVLPDEVSVTAPDEAAKDIEMSEHDRQLAEADDLLEQEEDDDLANVMIEEAEENSRFEQVDNSAEIEQLRKTFAKEKRDADQVTMEMVYECQELLQIFGIPYVTAPSEAEAQCSELFAHHLVDGIVTDDGDCFLFGDVKVYRNMFNQAKYVECYESSQIDKDLGLDRDKLISLAFLLGSDYTDGLLGIGPVTGVEILADFGTLEKFKEWWDHAQRYPAEADVSTPFRKRFLKQFLSKLFLDEKFPDSVVVDAYKHPEVDTDDTAFQWGDPDIPGLRRFLSMTAGWDLEAVDRQIRPVLEERKRRELLSKQTNSQSTLDRYFEIQKDLSKSKRATSATKKLAHRR